MMHPLWGLVPLWFAAFMAVQCWDIYRVESRRGWEPTPVFCFGSLVLCSAVLVGLAVMAFLGRVTV